MDSFDYTPQQALLDAQEATETHDPDGAIIILFKGVDTSDAEIIHYVSGSTSLNVVSCLDVVKTKFLLQLMS